MPAITKIGVSDILGGTLANGQVSNVKVNGADINVNGGGNMMAASLYGELMQCEDMRVYSATAARTAQN